MRCPNCAKEIREGSAFCGYCGKPIPKTPNAAPSAQRPAQSAQRPAQSAQRPAQSAQRPTQPSQRPTQPSAQPWPPTPKKPEKKRTGLIVAVCVLAFLLIAGGVFAFFAIRGDIDLGGIFSSERQEDTGRDRDDEDEDDEEDDRSSKNKDDKDDRNSKDKDDEDDRDRDDKDGDDRGSKNKEKDDDGEGAVAPVEETPRALNSFLYADIAVCVEDQMQLWPDSREKPFVDAATRLYRQTDLSLLVVTVDSAGGDIAGFTDNYVRQYRINNTDAGSLLNEVVAITFDASRRSCYMARYTDSAHAYDLGGLTTLVASYIADGDYETAAVYLLKNAKEIVSEFLLPNSATEYLSEADLRNLTWEECCFARNEIYARHGRVFSTPEIRAYFESKSWYSGTIPGADFDANTGYYLSDIERANANMILTYERDTWGGSYY